MCNAHSSLLGLEARLDSNMYITVMRLYTAATAATGRQRLRMSAVLPVRQSREKQWITILNIGTENEPATTLMTHLLSTDHLLSLSEDCVIYVLLPVGVGWRRDSSFASSIGRIAVFSISCGM